MCRSVQRSEQISEKIARASFWTAGLVSLSIVGAVFGFIGWIGWPTFRVQGVEFLIGHEWSVADGRFGALPMFIGSAIVTFTALVLALPLGLSAAFVTAEAVPEKVRPVLKFLMEILAGIPSVIYGLVGIAVLIPFMQTQLDLLTGRTLLTAGIVLAVMILPTMATLAEDAIKAVPREKREAGWALGLTTIGAIRHCVLPEAKAGIIAAVVLAAGRAVGETIAVMLLVGSLDRMPSPWYDWLTPGQTFTSKIAREAAESAVGSPQYHALAALAFILLVSVSFMSLAAGRLLANDRGVR
jgi:phosphate transport system permease protein